MNVYATVDAAKARMGITSTTYDTIILEMLNSVSRAIDGDCHRFFYTTNDTYYGDTINTHNVNLPEDLITCTTFTTDSEADGTYDGETWTENTDFYLWPYNTYPRLRAILTGFGSYSFPDRESRYLKIVGVWGYGDGTSDPWTTTAITGTVATAAGTSLTLSAAGTVEAGHTLKIESEQIFVSSVSTTTATVQRGVNGTDGAVHAAKTISLAQYPYVIKQACLCMIARIYREMGSDLLESERIGDYSYKRFAPDRIKEMERRTYAFYRKLNI